MGPKQANIQTNELPTISSFYRERGSFYSADSISVRCGEWDLTSEQTNKLELNKHQDRLAKSISIHPSYTGSKRLYNDVAVIHLERPFELTINIQPIPLPNPEEPYDVNDCVVTGKVTYNRLAIIMLSYQGRRNLVAGYGS